MEIIGYLVTGILEIVLCIVISELLDRKLSKKGAEFDSFKRTSSELDSKTESRMHYSIRKNETTQ